MPGGRPRGSKNKATKPIRDAIAAKDPIGKLFDLAERAREEGNGELEHKALATVLPYGFPRLAATSVDLQAALMGDVVLEVKLNPDEPDEG